MIQNNRLWVLISRLLSGEATPAEAAELQQLLEKSPQNQYLLDILHSYFTALPAEKNESTFPDTELAARFEKIVDPVSQRTARPPFRRILAYATAIAAALLLGWGFYAMRPATAGPREPRGGEVLSRAGARTKLVLPDGTQVWLNASSRLKYSRPFDGPSREVELEGEAYFDVAKDIQRPFIVHTSALDVKVLGTAFTVKSYPQDATIETTLLNGTIEVFRQSNPGAPRVILKPNEKLVFNKQSAMSPASATAADSTRNTVGPNRAGRSRIQLPDIAVNSLPLNVPDSNKEETAWLYNRLVFTGDSFEELAEKMERWYNVKIFFKDRALYNYHFGGAFANESVQDALNALQLTADFSYKINGNEIELYGKQRQ